MDRWEESAEYYKIIESEVIPAIDKVFQTAMSKRHSTFESTEQTRYRVNGFANYMNFRIPQHIANYVRGINEHLDKIDDMKIVDSNGHDAYNITYTDGNGNKLCGEDISAVRLAEKYPEKITSEIAERTKLMNEISNLKRYRIDMVTHIISISAIVLLIIAYLVK